MSAPTVDITNMDTSNMAPNSEEIYKQKAVISSKNMFNTALRSLKQHPNLYKLVIFEQPPRFDTPRTDPTSLKSTLARVANATLSELWENSPLKDKICIGRHSLESSGAGAVHFERYENNFTGKYDGVHLYGLTGANDYTNSVKSILLLALPEYIPTTTKCGPTQPNDQTKCQQTKYQQNTSYHPSVQPQNRFSVFSSNMGKNC